jgi:hypothetical protein
METSGSSVRRQREHIKSGVFCSAGLDSDGIPVAIFGGAARGIQSVENRIRVLSSSNSTEAVAP